jgi:acetolactate synthase I/II/III large subunit
LRRPGLFSIARIQKALRCDLFAQSLVGYIERGAGLPRVSRVGYFPEQATAMLSSYTTVLLAGTSEPVTFFGYPGVKSRILSDDQEKIALCTERQDVAAALQCLADVLKAPKIYTGPSERIDRPGLPGGELTAERACITLAALQPEDAIIVDEALTSGTAYYPLTASLPPHTIMALAGGAIGYGIPCALGAAVACPDRPVISLQADGSALYTVQGLWTQAHEGLNVTTLICSNRSYRILQIELARPGIPSAGASPFMDFKAPRIDWVKIACGFGVPGVSVGTAEDLAKQLGKALAEPGPHLIEMLLP